MMDHPQFSAALSKIRTLLEQAVRNQECEVNIRCECSTGKVASMLATAVLERAVMSTSQHPVLRIHHKTNDGDDRAVGKVPCDQCRTVRVQPFQFFMLKDIGATLRMEALPGGRYGLPWHEPGLPFPKPVAPDVKTSDRSAVQAGQLLNFIWFWSWVCFFVLGPIKFAGVWGMG
jgi:hypothetical protein